MPVRYRFSMMLMALLGSLALASDEPTWSKAQTDEILDKTLRLELSPSLDHLTPAEHRAVALLLQTGDILHELYMDTLHVDAVKAGAALAEQVRTAPTPETKGLMDLYYLFRGPVATTLDNDRVAFLPISPEQSGRNFYPAGTTEADLSGWMTAHPEYRAELMHPRSVVRKADAASIAHDLATLEAFPHLKFLHPGLVERLNAAKAAGAGFYGLPYSVAYAKRLSKAHDLLCEASRVIEAEDEDFAAYLRLRARDLVTDDYEAGDAAWVTGKFKRLNAQIGSYETYDDKLFGVKSAFSLSLLVRDEARTEKLRAAIGGLQELENSLPYDHHKKVRDDIPVGVYQVVADFGQARGTNTASILPNEAQLARKYGRTILLRHNIMTNPKIFEITKAVWDVAVLEKHKDDLTLSANFNRTLWHEIGHYLGPDRDKQGRSLSEALGKYSDLMEELKADLVSLYSVKFLAEKGFYTEDEVKAIYAGGIYRTLQKVRPRPTQPYQSMQLMQFNFFLAHPVLTFKPGHGQKLEIDYTAYHATVEKMLKKVMELQYEADHDQIFQFVFGLSMWTDWLHAKLAENLANASPWRYRLVTYGALK